MLFSNKKNEIFRWIFNEEESLNNAYSIPLQEKERGYFTKFFCENKGNHTIFKHNKSVFYFHLKASKIKELFKLREINVESIAFDERASDTSNSTNVKKNFIFYF